MEERIQMRAENRKCFVVVFFLGKQKHRTFAFFKGSIVQCFIPCWCLLTVKAFNSGVKLPSQCFPPLCYVSTRTMTMFSHWKSQLQEVKAKIVQVLVYIFGSTLNHSRLKSSRCFLLKSFQETAVDWVMPHLSLILPQVQRMRWAGFQGFASQGVGNWDYRDVHSTVSASWWCKCTSK
jgi:hypothetical protein